MKKVFKFFLNLFPRQFLIKASYAVRPVIAAFYKGDRYEDPIDGTTFRSFLPYGYVNIRENVLSPSTLSLERHRLLWLYLNRETDLFERPQHLLHFAPEQCFHSRFRESENLTYTTTDLDSPLADVNADIRALPFEDNSFDFILCNHVLEHVDDDLKAMSELFRVLKPGGKAVIQVPLENDLANTFEDNSITNRKKRTEIFGQYDHVRVYGMDYFERLRSVGFKASAVDYTSTFSNEEIDRYRLEKGELIPVVMKPVA